MKPLLVAALLALVIVRSAQPKGNPMFYRLLSRFNPDSSSMRVNVHVDTAALICDLTSSFRCLF